MQIQSNDLVLGRPPKYSSIFDCCKQILRENGVKGLYKSGVVTICREIPGIAA